MSISSNEIIVRRSANVSATAANGGRMIASNTALISGVKNNIWPDVNESERTNGSTLYRKVFMHIANDDDLTLVQARAFIETPTPGDDSVTMFPGTFTDTQANITGTERKYGCGYLNANAAIGANTIQVLTEGASLGIFVVGDKIRISDKASVSAAVGNEQVLTIAAGGISYAGNIATLTTVETLNFGFAASNTRVASMLQAGDVKGTVASFTKTSASGTTDTVGAPITVDSISGIEQNWTITFTSGTAFSCSGDTVGAVGSGNVSSSFQPTNSNFAKPYFVIPAAFWGGSFLAGDTVTFTTHPCAIPLWLRRDIPVGANSLTGNSVFFGLDGESA